VIEMAGPDLLDASGWELRKTLRLFAKCNLALNEWLNSPIVYREASGFRTRMQALMPSYFNPIAAVHHYASMARAAYDSCGADGTIRTKKLFYVLRALLACRWIERKLSQPPTEFARLAAEVANESEKSWIADLLVKKARGHETDETPLSLLRRDAIAQELTFLAEYPSRAPRSTRGSEETLDAMLASWLLGEDSR
jgi:predicted nucleotidyltransferase